MAQGNEYKPRLFLELPEGITPEQVDTYLFPRNLNRKKRIKEYIDADHPVMERWYDWLEHDVGCEKDVEELLEIHKTDVEFFDPWIRKSELAMDVDEDEMAFEIAAAGYAIAAVKIADINGDWPERMEWGFLTNRHLIRMLHHFGWTLWYYGQSQHALQIFRRLLRMCPNDNIGVRYEILSIRLGLDPVGWEDSFLVTDGPMAGTALDAFSVNTWFSEESQNFPDEFAWWEKEMATLHGE